MPPVEAELRPEVEVVVLRCLAVVPPDCLAIEPDPPLRGDTVRAGERPPDPTMVELGEEGLGEGKGGRLPF